MAAAAAPPPDGRLLGTVRAVTTPSAEELLAQEVVAGHVRSLMAEHLLDVNRPTSTRSSRGSSAGWTWRRRSSNLKEEHFPLVGGRLDYIDGRPAAAPVYKCNDHVINVFVGREAGRDGPPVFLERQGYHLAHWGDNERAFWVVSDLNEEGLRQFVELMRR